jgi:hypothetical protein
MEQTKKALSTDQVVLPLMQIPTFRTSLAIQNGVHKNLIVKTWGGLGDQICTEPTLRYMLKHFTDCKISLAAELPELFSHLKFHKVFDLKESTPVWENYLVFQTITPQTDLTWEFMSHMITHCVDFTSLCALRCQLPNAEKEVILKPLADAVKMADLKIPENAIYIHAGKHWQSKTFPKDFWDSVLNEILLRGGKPVLIGANTDDNRGTVDVDTSGCLDLRNKLSVLESIWLLQRAKVLLTNDSSPLHMAAPGDAWIGFIATCKHPDYITHWRKGEFGWRQKNFGKGGIWDIINHNPNAESEVTAEYVKPEILRSWLPDPSEFAAWAVSKTKE